MARKPTPVKLPDELLEQIDAAAKEGPEENRSTVIRAALRFFFKYRHREAELEREGQFKQPEGHPKLPWLEDKKPEAPKQQPEQQRAIPGKALVWRPGGSKGQQT
jgi:Arc/MetJ-type ribon-helix-helix transcriptional regulator